MNRTKRFPTWKVFFFVSEQAKTRRWINTSFNYLLSFFLRSRFFRPKRGQKKEVEEKEKKKRKKNDRAGSGGKQKSVCSCARAFFLRFFQSNQNRKWKRKAKRKCRLLLSRADPEGRPRGCRGWKTTPNALIRQGWQQRVKCRWRFALLTSKFLSCAVEVWPSFFFQDLIRIYYGD